MKDPRVTLQTKIGDALETAITAAGGYSDVSLMVVVNPDVNTPAAYVQLDASPTIEPWPARETNGAITTWRLMAYAETLAAAQDLAAIVADTLDHPTTHLTLASPHQVVIARLGFSPGAIPQPERVGATTEWGVPVVMRYYTMEAA